MEKILNRMAIAKNGHEIVVTLIPNEKKQNTLTGFINVEVGKKILLQSGQEVEFNLDGNSFYIAPNEMYKLV